MYVRAPNDARFSDLGHSGDLDNETGRQSKRDAARSRMEISLEGVQHRREQNLLRFCGNGLLMNSEVHQNDESPKTGNRPDVFADSNLC